MNVMNKGDSVQFIENNAKFRTTYEGNFTGELFTNKQGRLFFCVLVIKKIHIDKDGKEHLYNYSVENPCKMYIEKKYLVS